MYYLGNLEIESPWGNAGGTVKSVEDVEAMARTGTGIIEGGSWTLERRLGNAWNPETNEYDITTYVHNPITGETFNSLGMPNKGMDVVEAEIPDMVDMAEAHGKVLIANVAPVTDEPVAETQELVDRVLEAGAHKALINAGCPNVVTGDGGRHEILSHNPAALAQVLGSLAGLAMKYDQKFAIRLSPMPNWELMKRIMFVVQRSRVIDLVYTPNTWPGRYLDENGDPIINVAGGVCGRSGPATAGAANEQTYRAVQSLRGSGIDVVSSGGIMNGEELARRLKVGAVAGAGTTLYYESAEEGWAEATDRLLRQFAQSRSAR